MENYTSAQWKSIENAKSKLKDAQGQVELYSYRAKKTAEEMKEWSNRSPNLYKQLDELPVDIMLGVDNIFDASQLSNGVVGGKTS